VDGRFERSFQALYEGEYPILHPILRENPLIGRVQAAVDAADQELRSRTDSSLRPDAKLALFANAVAMIVLPVQVAVQGSVEPPPAPANAELERAMQALDSDVNTIAQGAAALHPETHDVSSHAIYESIIENWRELQLAGLPWD
jgi:hypothetical protein